MNEKMNDLTELVDKILDDYSLITYTLILTALPANLRGAQRAATFLKNVGYKPADFYGGAFVSGSHAELWKRQKSIDFMLAEGVLYEEAQKELCMRAQLIIARNIPRDVAAADNLTSTKTLKIDLFGPFYTRKETKTAQQKHVLDSYGIVLQKLFAGIKDANIAFGIYSVKMHVERHYVFHPKPQ